MRKYDFEESIGYWLHNGREAYFRALEDELQPYNITYRQCQVLGILNLHGAQTQAELASHMRIEPPTLVGVLDRMQRDGWVKRTPVKDDRRKWLIQSTPAANEAWETIVECAHRIRKRAVEGLSQRQVDSLRGLLETVTKNLDRRPKSVPTGSSPIRKLRTGTKS